MSAVPRYLKKYRQKVSGKSSWEAFSDYLEQLDAKDWTEFLEDLLVTRPPAVHEVVAPAPGSGLLEYAARLLQQSSAASMERGAAALNQVIARAVASLPDPDAVRTIARGLRLTEMLGASAHVDAAAAIVFNPEIPWELRAEAALVVSDRESRVHWQTVDLEREWFLLPAVVTALSADDPRAAMHALVATPTAPAAEEMLDYPVRIALRKLMRDGGISSAAQLLETLPERHWARRYVWTRTLKLKEFARLREALSRDPVPVLPAGSKSLKAQPRPVELVVTRMADELWVGFDLKQLLNAVNGYSPSPTLLALAGDSGDDGRGLLTAGHS